MSSNREDNLPNALPPIQQPRSLSQLARIEIEKPARKMRLMFGENQVVFLRSDGLRSRMVRNNMRNIRNEKSRDSREEQPSNSTTLDEVIEDVASGKISNESVTPTSSTEALPDAAGSNMKTQPELKLEDRPKNKCSTSGNRSYHPPSEFHGSSTISTHKRRWTYQTSCLINAEEQKDDNQIGYAPDPFLPMPRGRQNEISTAARMNYAAQRLENRKYRGQAKMYRTVKNTPDRDSITCDKCKMKYFSESRNIQEQISYLPSVNEEVLPTVVFNCPVCKEITNAAF